MKLRAVAPLLVCSLLIAYASLFPLVGWRHPNDGFFAWCALNLSRRISRSDFLVNIIAYIPLGYLAQRLLPCVGPARFLPWAVLAGAGLSFAMESLQSALLTRDASPVDLFTNTIGTACGAVAALLWQGTTAQHGVLKRWREKHLLPGELSVAGAVVLSLWALSQWSPFVPPWTWEESRMRSNPFGERRTPFPASTSTTPSPTAAISPALESCRRLPSPGAPSAASQCSRRSS